MKGAIYFPSVNPIEQMVSQGICLAAKLLLRFNRSWSALWSHDAQFDSGLFIENFSLFLNDRQEGDTYSPKTLHFFWCVDNHIERPV